MKPRVVLDTNVIFAGLSSRKGASHAILRNVLSGDLEILASPPLWLEYEAVMKRPENVEFHGLSMLDIDHFLSGLATRITPVRLHYRWRPQLRDPNDEMVLETAINGSATALVTFNTADFRHAIIRFFPKLMTPAHFFVRWRRRNERVRPATT